MKLAHIAPTQALYTQTFSKLDFHLCLADQVLKDAEYRAYFRNCRGHVILDVPTYEARDASGPYPITCLIDAIDAVQPSEVVLPDVWHSSAQVNNLAAIQAADVLSGCKSGRGPLGFIVVPRGSNVDEYLQSATFMSQIQGVTAIGITGGMEQRFSIDRSIFVEGVYNLGLGKAIHLLGVGENFEDIQNHRVRSWVRSADTAKLVRFGLEHKLATYKNIPAYPHRGKGYFERPVSDLDESYIARNINYWNSFVGRE